MIKLEFPKVSDGDIITDCANSIKSPLGKKLLDSKIKLLQTYNDYDNAPRELHSLPISESKNNSIVVGDLSHNELTSLYSQYFVPSSKPCRKYYDEIMKNAKGYCPYCSGINKPSTLDHYLVKSKFPSYAIFSKNLVPACSICNGSLVGKGTNVPKKEEALPIHPYYDKDIFFEEQWVFAKYKKNDFSNFIKYYVIPPENWDTKDKARAHAHFTLFGLYERFARNATNELSSTERQIDTNCQKYTVKDMIENIIEPITVNEFGVNHWRRVMYLALKYHYSNVV